MRKTVITVSILAFIASGCGQTAKKTANNELAVKEVQGENDKTAEQTLKE